MFIRSLATRRSLALVVAVAGLGLTSAGASGAPATYTHTQTIPVPPASNYAGVGGGDGWGISLSPTSVYNVFHHSGQYTVACHKQSDALACWPAKTVRDASNRNFGSTGQSGTYLDQATGRLYGFAARDDKTGGVVCFDTAAADAGNDPFCGFTELTPIGGQPVTNSAAISNPSVVGTRMYAINYVNTTGDAGAANRVLCFDFAAVAPCAGQPYSVGISGTVVAPNYPAPASALIAGRIFFPLRVDGATQVLCFEVATSAACGGSWPQAAPAVTPGSTASPFPLLTATGTPTGLCFPTGPGAPCFALDGTPVTVPAALNAAIPSSSPWNSPAVVIGPRVYIPNGNKDEVVCWDFLADKACTGFPKPTTGAGYMYSVNPDPQRPDCIWVNADYGQAQIQNFDAFSGGPCGQGAIRVLASSFIAPQAKCAPTKYLALRLVDPVRSAYADGTVTIADGSGSALAGTGALSLDAAGAVDLTTLPIDPATGLPQFIIALNGAPAQQAAVTVELSWRADYDALCETPGTKAAQDPVPTPTPTAAPTPAPTPAPQGAVLAARAEPRLVGRARFGARSLRVGKTTTLRVSITNSGNAASTTGDVCVRLSSALVVVKVPTGVTVKGSVLCARRNAVNAGASTTVIRGIVVRGTVATRSATVRDASNDGVTVTGDQLRVLRLQAPRAGGVTG